MKPLNRMLRYGKTGEYIGRHAFFFSRFVWLRDNQQRDVKTILQFIGGNTLTEVDIEAGERRAELEYPKSGGQE